MTVLAERTTNQQVSVLETAEIIRPYIKTAPLRVYAHLGRNVILLANDESEQVTGSFKVRGAISKMSRLREEGIWEVTAASAGNHSAGVAYAAKMLGMHADVFMPELTPKQKIDNTKSMGGDAVSVHLVPGEFNDSLDRAVMESGPDKHMVPPFDDYEVIAGQGTLTGDALVRRPQIDRVFGPVGGGGQIAGALLAVEELGSQAHVYGVQYSSNLSLERSIKSGQVESLDYAPDSLVEGSAVRAIGRRCLEVMQRFPERFTPFSVNAADLGREIEYLSEVCEMNVPVLGEAAFESFPEPTGLLGVAGARKYFEEHPEVHDEVWLVNITGSNRDAQKEDLLRNEWQESKVLNLQPRVKVF